MKKIFLFIVAITTSFLIIVSSPSNVHSNISGAPAGRTGSPADGVTCNASGCHSGSPVVVNNNIISSDIPANGYIPGVTYNFDVTIAQTGINRYGFEISPQNVDGVLQGTMILTNTTNTKLISSGKYITHKQAGVVGTNNSKTWTFQWIAPEDLAIDQVTFYGAINAANANNSATGDHILTTQYTVLRDPNVGIHDVSSPLSMGVFPNPFTGNTITLDFILEKPAPVNVQLYGVDGKLLRNEFNALQVSGKQKIQLNTGDLNPGIYIVALKAGEKSSFAKVIKN